MAITDGLSNPPSAVFPLYYIENPAMQRAFEHFWANSPGPNGIGLQDYFVQGLERVVARFADNPLVLGTELINEPFPGKTWQACVTGCADLEQQRLLPFYQKGERRGAWSRTATVGLRRAVRLVQFRDGDDQPARDRCGHRTCRSFIRRKHRR